jgi:hypothetical protein
MEATPAAGIMHVLIVRHTATFITNACNDGQHDEVPGSSVIDILINLADSSRWMRYLMHAFDHLQAQKYTLSMTIALGVANLCLVWTKFAANRWLSL